MKRGQTICLLLLGGLLVLVALGADAWARPGGGSSYSGGGGSSYSGGGGSSYSGGGGSSWGGGGSSYSGGGGKASLGSVVLMFIVCMVVLILVSAAKNKESSLSWETTHAAAPEPPPVVSWNELRAEDPNFSRLLFEDFVYELYCRAQEARSDRAALDRLGPYLASGALGQLAGRRNPKDVTGVVVGALRPLACTLEHDYAKVCVEFEANYSESAAAGGAVTGYYAREQWVLRRKRGAKSRTPEGIANFGCPSCGAPVTTRSQDEPCAHCGSLLTPGEFDWAVQTIQLIDEEPRGPLLTGAVEEQGTDLPTLYDAGLRQMLGALQARDPEFSPQTFIQRVGLVYNEMNQAWSSLAWDRARPYLSDRMWMSQTYWINAYRAQGLQNKMDQAGLGKVELVRVSHDPFYDGVTVRIFASGFDYTVNLNGQVVSGSKDFSRSYSEYWTFIRSAKRKGPARTDKNCPGCGGDLKINQTGNCAYCQAKVTSGDFDWVLSRIEQDESYTG